MKEWSDTVRDNLRALHYWRRITDGLAIITVVGLSLGVILWFVQAL